MPRQQEEDIMALEIVKYSWRKCWLRLVLVCAVGVLTFEQVYGQAPPPEKEPDGVVLSVAVVKDSSPTRLALTLENGGKGIFASRAIGTKLSRLVMTTDDGKEVEHALAVERPDPVQVLPGKSRTWIAGVPKAFWSRALKELGVCSVRWKLQDMSSDPVLLHTNGVALSVGVETGSSPTKLLFVLRNNGKKVFVTTPVGMNYSRLVIVDSEGKEFEIYESVRFAPGGRGISVGPSKSQTWRMDIAFWLKVKKIDLSQPYRVFWRIHELESPSIWFYPPAKK
jgi:hypothetical protein